MSRPIHFAFSYDEEAGCRGVPHCSGSSGACAPRRWARLSASRAVCRRSELTRARRPPASRSMARPAIRRAPIRVSTPFMPCCGDGRGDEGSRDSAERPFDQTFEPPYSTLQIGTIVGGRASTSSLISALGNGSPRRARRLAHGSTGTCQGSCRGAGEGRFSHGLGDLQHLPRAVACCRRAACPADGGTDGSATLAAVSYGTEAGLYQAAGIDAIICGPGDIARAHRADEFIRVDELVACQAMIERLAETLPRAERDFDGFSGSIPIAREGASSREAFARDLPGSAFRHG